MALTGQSSHHSAGFHGDTLVEVELAETHWGLTTADPRSPQPCWNKWASPFRVSLSCLVDDTALSGSGGGAG